MIPTDQVIDVGRSARGRPRDDDAVGGEEFGSFSSFGNAYVGGYRMRAGFNLNNGVFLMIFGKHLLWYDGGDKPVFFLDIGEDPHMLSANLSPIP